MEKQLFTPSGVLALQQWLYQLPQLEFDAEILAMETNFEVWSLTHLTLDAQQIIFYNQLGGTAKNNLAYNVKLAAAYKKPIRLVQLLQKSDDADSEEDKLFKPKSTLAVTSDSNGSYEVEGELEIEVTYLN